MNGRRWTNDNFEFEERIECTIQLTVSEAIGSTVFKGSMQVQSSRPVFNSDYNTPVLLVNDGDIQFEWLDNSTILFNPGQHRDNLSSLLAYYAYMILGMDYDTFSLEGGTPHFLQAQAIVANAQNAGERGWKASQGKQNRYWLVENHLSQTFRPVRICLYNYHRKGLDVLFQDIEGGRLTIAESLIDMRSTNRIRPGSYNIQVFFCPRATRSSTSSACARRRARPPASHSEAAGPWKHPVLRPEFGLMLRRIHIRNHALITEVELNFDEGFTSSLEKPARARASCWAPWACCLASGPTPQVWDCRPTALWWKAGSAHLTWKVGCWPKTCPPPLG